MPSQPVIAVVDDDPEMREALSELLQVQSLQCRTFKNAEDFLDAYEPGVFSCLITDVRMPGISGLELIWRLRKQGETLPSIVISSSVDEQVGAHAMANGALAFLRKPVEDQTLLRHISTAIARHSAS